MRERGRHRDFLRYTAGIFLVTAAVAASVAGLNRGPSPDPGVPIVGASGDEALHQIRRYLQQAHGLKVLVEDGKAAIAWNDGFRLEGHAILDYLKPHPFTFVAHAAAGSAPDVYRARARVAADGTPIEISDLINLTRTEHGEEHALAVHGPFVAFLNRIDGLLRQVVLLDYRGEPQSPKQGLLDRWMDAVTNWQMLGDRRGIGRSTYEFEKAPARASLRFEGDPSRLVVQLGDGRQGFIDPESGALSGEGASSLVASPAPPKARQMFVDWVANTVRRVIGERRFEWLKVYVLATKDKWRRIANALFGPGSPDSDDVESGPVVAAHAPARRSQIQFGQDPNWPPSGVEPILKQPRLKGEGQWVDLYDFDLRNPWAPPALLKTVLRPDPQRPHAAVRIVLMDPRQVDLHIVAGTKHPESTTGRQGDGLIPRDKGTLSRLLAAFNGGFKTMHGAYGMMVRGKVIVPAKSGAATVATLKDGRTAIGTWELPAGIIPPQVTSFRQNLPPLVQGAVVNPTGLKRWGNTVDDMDGIHTYRSAIGVTRHGHLMYVWGDDLSAETMARAMVQAGCDFAIHLDMNYGHSRFELYRVYDDETFPRRHPDRKVYVEGNIRYQAKKLSNAQISWLYPRYIRRDIRDFFYLTLRQTFPYEDPNAPAWSVEKLPPELQEFPPLLVRTNVRLGQDDVALYKIDATRIRLGLRLGGAEAFGLPAAAREIAREEVARLALVIAAGTPDEGMRAPGSRLSGAVHAPLRPGGMALVLDRSGRPRVERWSEATPAERAWSARQGLALVEEGKVCEDARLAAPSRPIWRGAIGVDARGDLLYAAARTAAPTVLAEALVSAGAVRAVALGPGTAEAFFRTYTPGEREGELVETDLPTEQRSVLRAIPLVHPQTFLYLTPEAPPPRVLPLAQIATPAEKTVRR